MKLTFEPYTVKSPIFRTKLLLNLRSDIRNHIKKVGVKLADKKTSELIYKDLEEMNEPPMFEDDVHKQYFINNDIIIVHKKNHNVLITTDSILDWMLNS